MRFLNWIAILVVCSLSLCSIARSDELVRSGKQALKDKKYDLAIGCFERALKLCKSGKASTFKIKYWLARALYRQGDLYRANSLIDEIDTFTKKRLRDEHPFRRRVLTLRTAINKLSKTKLAKPKASPKPKVKPLPIELDLPATLAPPAGKKKTFINSIGMKFSWIPPGSFEMGSPASEKGRKAHEGPVRTVRFARGFFMAQTEVTKEQYAKLFRFEHMSLTNEKLPPRRPAEFSDLFSAVRFCSHITDEDIRAGKLAPGWEYRVPSEAEWEYACRAGTKTPYSFGKDLSTEQANYLPSYEEKKAGAISRKGTIDVGSFPPNAFGLFDLHGNAREFCLDAYHPNYEGAPTDGSAWGFGQRYNIFRGGCCHFRKHECRSASRNYEKGEIIHGSKGLRVVLAPRRMSAEEKAFWPATYAQKTSPQTKASMKEGLPFTNSVSMKLVWIPPGFSKIGEIPKEKNEQKHTSKWRRVCIAHGFWMGAYEVQQKTFETVMKVNPSRRKGPNLPVEMVDWPKAIEFCKKLSAIERKAGNLPPNYRYCLPSENQWEYAARAGTKTASHFGHTMTGAQANINPVYPLNAKSNKKLRRTGGAKIKPVGSYKSNAFGLFDIHGNVAEWCLDTWHESLPYGAPHFAMPWVANQTYSSIYKDKPRRIVRGGSCGSSGAEASSYAREAKPEKGMAYVVGFRVVVVRGTW